MCGPVFCKVTIEKGVALGDNISHGTDLMCTKLCPNAQRLETYLDRTRDLHISQIRACGELDRIDYLADGQRGRK